MNICIYKHKPRVGVTLHILEAYERALKGQGHSILIMSQDMENFSPDQAKDFATRFIGFKADLAICYGFSAMPRIGGGFFFRKQGIPLAILCFENPFFGLNKELIDEIKTHNDFYSFFVWDSIYLDLLKKLFDNCFSIQHAADITQENHITNNCEYSIERDITFVGNISDFPKLRSERLARDDLTNNLIDEILNEKIKNPCANPLHIYHQILTDRTDKEVLPFSKTTDPDLHQQILFPVYLEGLGLYRHYFLNQLKPFNIHYYGGVKWQSNHITFHDPVDYTHKLARIYKTTAINLDIPPFQSIDALDNRVFDVGGSGSFLLTQKTPQLSRLFDDADKITYENVHDLEEKIRYYMENPSQRVKLSESLYNCIRKNHTYHHRVPFLLDMVKTAHRV